MNSSFAKKILLKAFGIGLENMYDKNNFYISNTLTIIANFLIDSRHISTFFMLCFIKKTAENDDLLHLEYRARVGKNFILVTR